MLPQFCQHFGKDVPVFGCISTDLLASRYSFPNMYFKIQLYIEAFNWGFTHNLANFRKLPICLQYQIEKLLQVETFRTSLLFLPTSWQSLTLEQVQKYESNVKTWKNLPAIQEFSHVVDLENFANCCKTNSYLQRSVSMQPRKSVFKVIIIISWGLMEFFSTHLRRRKKEDSTDFKVGGESNPFVHPPRSPRSSSASSPPGWTADCSVFSAVRRVHRGRRGRKRARKRSSYHKYFILTGPNNESYDVLSSQKMRSPSRGDRTFRLEKSKR